MTKLRVLRVAVPAAVLVALAVGLALNYGTGTLSAFGWRDLSLLCPLGALTSMLAEKTIVPRAVISLALVVVIILITGRAFCSWVCPVPLVSRLRTAFSFKGTRTGTQGEEGVEERSPEEKAALPCGKAVACAGTEAGCAACSQRLSRVDSRHLILGGTLLSAAIFGFPVFCLICPIGLTFGTILLLVALFGYGDVTWSVLLVPALLLVEVVFFRKWCTKVCPLGALLGLIAKANRTLRPTIDANVCMEKSKGVPCGRCTRACEQGINLRNPALGAAKGECTRCLACVQVCPTRAIKVPVLAARRANAPAVNTVRDDTSDS